METIEVFLTQADLKLLVASLDLEISTAFEAAGQTQEHRLARVRHAADLRDQLAADWRALKWGEEGEEVKNE